MINKNYISRKLRLLKDFDKAIARVKRVLTSRYGDEKIKSL